MKKHYNTPQLIDYGTITENTFATPAVANRYGVSVENTLPLGDGNYACGSSAGVYSGQGGKNYIVLQCDKFGEYSHS